MSDLSVTSVIPKPVGRRPLAPAAFSVSARVAMQLGRESISTSNTAILELVKNAYDADATRLRIRFRGLGTPGATLVIEDNGNGMTEEEIREYWLCIGTTNKQDVSLSRKNKRVQTGEKGLGRLGLDRLARRTLLQTKRRLLDDDPDQLKLTLTEGSRALELNIEWDRYTARGQRLETVAHEVYELDHLDIDPITDEHAPFAHGTRLILEGLKDDWTVRRIEDLRHDLALTLSPFSDQSDFRISIESGLPDLDGPVHPNKELLHLATWTVQAAIEASPDHAEETVWVKMSSHAHNRSYQLGPLPWKEFTKHAGDLAPKKSRCGPVTIDLHVFIRNTDDLGGELTEVGDFLEANRGIRIFRDGFRIKPYGDPKGANDWLSLSLKRAQNPAAISRKSWKVAYHQVVGAVLVSRNRNAELVDQTNREGLVDGPAMNDLRTFAQRVISFFEGKAHEDYVAQNPPKPKPAVAPQPAPDLASIESTLQSLATKAQDTATTPQPNATFGREFADQMQQALASVRAVKADLIATEKAHAEEIDELKDELRLTTSLASLGIMAASFGHERVKDAVLIRSNIGLLKDLYEHPQTTIFNETDRADALRFLEEGALRIESFAQFALEHVRPGKRRGSDSDLVSVISNTCRMFRATAITMKIDLDPDKQLPKAVVRVPGWQAGWESVIANLLINSFHFLRPRKPEDRKINVTLTPLPGEKVVLEYEDSGTGLIAGTETDIFRPGFSTRVGPDGLQEGTGLGLTLVRSFVTSLGGSVVARNSPTLGGACFTITVPMLPVSTDNV